MTASDPSEVTQDVPEDLTESKVAKDRQMKDIIK